MKSITANEVCKYHSFYKADIRYSTLQNGRFLEIKSTGMDINLKFKSSFKSLFLSTEGPVKLWNWMTTVRLQI